MGMTNSQNRKKIWSLSDWRYRNPKGLCKISKLKTGLWTLQVLVIFLHLLYGEVSVKILTSFSRARTRINILASGAVTSVTELGWLRVFSHPELIQWGNLWCILQIHAGTTSRNFALNVESHVNWCISALILQPFVCDFTTAPVTPNCDHHFTCLSPPWTTCFWKWRAITVSFDLVFLARVHCLVHCCFSMKFAEKINKWTMSANCTSFYHFRWTYPDSPLIDSKHHVCHFFLSF